MRQFFISGRCTKDAEILKSKDKKEFLKVSVAVNEYISKNKEEITYFYDVLIFGKNLDKKQKVLTKGKGIVVLGKPESSAYLDKNNDPQSSVTVIANDWDVL